MHEKLSRCDLESIFFLKSESLPTCNSDISYFALEMLLPGQKCNVIIDTIIFDVLIHIYGDTVRTSSDPESNYVTQQNRLVKEHGKPS